jgi:pimeloyl-ACP methyl ester carboxylesterase
MRAEDYSEADIQIALAFVSGVHDAARERLSYEAVEARLLKSARSQSWYRYMTIDDEDEWRLASRFVIEEYEPIKALQKVRCPFLAVYGGRDVLLPPWQSAKESGEALQRAGNPDAAVVVFPDGDHRIQHGPGNFVSGYLNLIVDWTATHVA